METFDKVKEVLVESLGCEEDSVTMEASLVEDLGAEDSLTMVELVMALEDAFSISIPEEKTKEIKTVGDILKIIENKAE